MFIPNSVLSLTLTIVWLVCHITIICLCFPIIYSLHWLSWQMPYQRFQCFDFSFSSGLLNCLYTLNSFPKQALVFSCLQNKCFENTVGNGEIAHYEQFLHLPWCFFPTVFSTLLRVLSAIFNI